jgi:chromosome segregation ATPase
MYEQAIQDIKFLSQRFKGLIEFAEFLDSFEALQNRFKEVDKALSEKLAELSESVETLDSLKKQQEAVQEDCRKTVQETEAEIIALLEKAKENANEIASEGRGKRDKFNKVFAQEQKAQIEILEKLRAEIEAEKRELASLVAEQEQIRNKLLELKNSLGV